MAYDLTCDSCEFALEVEDEVGAYAGAKEHEARYHDHFVFIRTVH